MVRYLKEQMAVSASMEFCHIDAYTPEDAWQTAPSVSQQEGLHDLKWKCAER